MTETYMRMVRVVFLNYKNKNGFSFSLLLFVALKQQISTFYSQVQRTDTSYIKFISQRPVINVLSFLKTSK